MNEDPKSSFHSGASHDSMMRERSFVERFFENQAATYSSQFDPSVRRGSAVLFQIRRRIAVELSAGVEPRALLDIATGTGEISLSVASSYGFEQIHLNDISKSMLRTCQRTFSSAHLSAKMCWTNNDAFELLPEIGQGQFNLILCLGVIAHTGRLPELLAKIFKCLRSGGALILQSSVTDHAGAWITTLYSQSPLRRTQYKGHAFSQREIISCACEAGFKIDEVRRYGICIPFGDRLLGPINYWLEAKYADKISARGGEAIFKLRKVK